MKLPVLLAALALAPLTAAACGAAPVSAPASPAPAAHGGVAGYQWTVVAIGHDGRETAIPARYHVDLQFTPGGQFVANDPVNSHSGTYRLAGDGFTTSELLVTAVGYISHDPVVPVAIGAISSFDEGSRAVVSNLAADKIVIAVRGYTLTCARAGPQADFPAPART